MPTSSYILEAAIDRAAERGEEEGPRSARVPGCGLVVSDAYQLRSTA